MLAAGVPLAQITKIAALEGIARAKIVPENELGKLDALEKEIEQQLNALTKAEVK